ncbi:MAG: hypothetical protein IKV41_04370 [Oscillospiraceae bacterium]|nr:hypothetical protein [Oscillospiraceae bacterium]
MLELKNYTKSELSEMFKTRGMQSLQRKLTRYGIDFDVKGRNENAIFTIKKISNPFKIFCITELEFDGRTDFLKVRNFFYYFFNDDEFRAMPDEVKEYRMRKQGQPVSRQTIFNYITKLEQKNLLDRSSGECIYYFTHKHEQRIVDKGEYVQAWQDYWNDIEKGFSRFEAIDNMKLIYGGVARKQPKPELNGIFLPQIEYLKTLVQQSIEQEIDTHD